MSRMSDHLVLEAYETAKNVDNVIKIMSEINHCTPEEMRKRCEDLAAAKKQDPDVGKKKRKRTREEINSDNEYTAVIQEREEIDAVREAEPPAINGGEKDLDNYEPSNGLPAAVNEVIAREIFMIDKEIAELRKTKEELRRFLSQKSA